MIPSNQLLRTALYAAALCLAGATAAQADLKIGVIDMSKIFSGYYKTKDAESKINEARESAKKELTDRLDSHKQLLDEINALNKGADSAALSAAARTERDKKRDDKIQEVRSLENDINEFRTSRERQLQEQTVRLRNTIVEEMMVVIRDRVKNENYDLVFDRSGQSAQGVPVLIQSRDNMDFTDNVLTQLNKSRPSPAPLPKH